MVSCEFQTDNETGCTKPGRKLCTPASLIKPKLRETVPWNDDIANMLLRGYPGCPDYKPKQELTSSLQSRG